MHFCSWLSLQKLVSCNNKFIVNHQKCLVKMVIKLLKSGSLVNWQCESITKLGHLETFNITIRSWGWKQTTGVLTYSGALLPSRFIYLNFIWFVFFPQLSPEYLQILKIPQQWGLYPKQIPFWMCKLTTYLKPLPLNLDVKLCGPCKAF